MSNKKISGVLVSKDRILFLVDAVWIDQSELAAEMVASSDTDVIKQIEVVIGQNIGNVLEKSDVVSEN